jgi:SAM-dependent methyltransferase
MDDHDKLARLLKLVEYDGMAGVLSDSGALRFGSHEIPVRDGIPRFTPDVSYSTGNFSLLREKHAELQLDSRNGTRDRENTILSRTGWPREFFRGKTILECGCGAGADTEILAKFEAQVVAVDLAGVDVASRNIGDSGQVTFLQADIQNLPLKHESFDIVICHRVLQHTPNPEITLDHILRFVKPDGAVFVHSYSRDLYQRCRWKYVFRPLTKRMNPERLYRLVERSGPFMFRLTTAIRRLPGGRYFNWVFVPFLNYGHKPKFRSWTDEQLIEFGVHDTFDALSPKYDHPLSERKFRKVAGRYLRRPFEITTGAAVTLLRTSL